MITVRIEVDMCMIRSLLYIHSKPPSEVQQTMTKPIRRRRMIVGIGATVAGLSLAGCAEPEEAPADEPFDLEVVADGVSE